MTNKIITLILSFAFVAGTGWVAATAYRMALYDESPANPFGGGASQGQTYYLTAGSGTGTGQGAVEATTTKIALTTTASASSTITGMLNRATQIDVQAVALASSSSATLRFVLETSNDAINYFPVSEATGVDQSPLATTIAETAHTWGLATTTTTGNSVFGHFVLKGPFAKYFRIRVGVGGANASVWMAATPREETPN